MSKSYLVALLRQWFHCLTGMFTGHRATVEAASVVSVEAAIKKHFGEVAETSLKKIDLPNSRQARLDAAQSLVEEAKSEVEELKDELQNWYDALPDSFQQGDQGDNLQSAIDDLGTIADDLEAVDFSSFSGFPGMRT